MQKLQPDGSFLAVLLYFHSLNINEECEWEKARVGLRSGFTVVQVAGEGGMGEDEVVEVGVLLECWKISSSKCECPGGEVATSV